ncbi:NEDD4-binding protein 3 [Hyla sarda]|uniref:NEDD4-binding protein 3 n=1 Tax=Hyla sarda TaxID=327740 RepID=UPI0024C31AC1|nr:NEDD4-binding protein 3 [Hyla sarda]XP_056430661.1 NEDD4-binding protein 3 [Hyla sarda]XP_056430662.1 NEDD4-binding protein 3 [Hyla sarda]XP_056430663.1 NEDD4-binding protein 3 [Hyla sarda]XP_056430664.1 NEDD4-binding protein 3 [Hyla sarda]
MAAAQTFSLSCDTRNHHLRSFNSDVSYRCNMGSVSSLIEKQEFSPDDINLDFKPLSDSHSPGNIFKRGLNQRELLNYLSIAKKEGKSGKKLSSGLLFRRERSVEGEENDYPVLYHKERRGTDFSKSSLPERGRFEKSRFGQSALKPSNAKNFMSMQSLCSSGQKLSKSNGSLNTLGSLNSPPRRGPLKSNNIHHMSQHESENDENESLSDSRQNSINSYNAYSPGFSVAHGQISASTGHINHIGGSLDRASRGVRDMASGEKKPLSCKSMATLSRLQCSGEPPPPYEYSQSVEDVARQLEERLYEKSMEIRQLRRSPSDKDDPFTQVFEDKRRLWMEELEELKQMYISKLQQISQQALRSQRALQLQLYKVQQEKKRLHEELNSLKGECEQLRQKPTKTENLSPKLEESKWEISQKAGEISLLKQQLRDCQAEITQKMGEVFLMKTQLRDAKHLAKEKERESTDLKARLQALEASKEKSPTSTQGNIFSVDDPKWAQKEASEASELERVKAELMLERRQNEAQLLNFEKERKIWKDEKEKVLRYQKEIQAGYLEMYHRNLALERQLQEVRPIPAQSPSTPSLWMDAVESFETT